MRDIKSQSAQMKYINELFAPEDDHLQGIRIELEKANKSGIQIDAYEGKTLFFLSKLIGAKRIVEIGTLFGYSTLWLARSLPDDGKLFSLEKSPENFKMAQQLLSQSEQATKLEVFLGDANESLQMLSEKGPFDMAFIDANKAGYCQYLDWAEEHVRTGGLIIGDNTFLFGELFREESERQVSSAQYLAMVEFNKRLSDPSRYNSVLIPTPEGLTLAQKIF